MALKIFELTRRIFPARNERELKKLYPIVEYINSLEKEYERLAESDFPQKTEELKKRLREGETLEDLLPEAFALVRQASKRTIGLRHFDVQLMGGIVLHQGKISEMKTGEGKTLVATLPVYLNSLSGLGVHLVTVNDYLAKRDSEWMGPIYRLLGLTVGKVQHDIPQEERQAAYRCDVTFVTNNEIGFDYLRDNMVLRKEDRVLRPLNYAIVDEVDSILIDEARTPLIISGPAEESTGKYFIVNKIVPHLKGRKVTEAEEIDAKYRGEDLSVGFDFISDEKSGTCTLTPEGIAKCERLLGIKNLYDDVQSEWAHHINQALRAHEHFEKDVDYVVKDGEVVIVDEFTGRLMPGRRWSEGLHQAIEAKEHMRIAEENQTLATITFQNFFRMYKKLAGMTGTALTEAGEFWEIYKLDVIELPTNKPMIRIDNPDVIYRTEKEKWEAIVSEIESLFREGRPALVGTRSIEKSEKLSKMLRQKNIPHSVLNAKYHEMEAQIIAQAGKKGRVTVATNMAGRGTDIVLGGNPQDKAEAEYIISKGGLHILGTERHESRRIDNQLRGRTGRQGDPGSSRFFLSLEDELMRLFGSDRISGVMARLGMEEGQDIQHPMVSRAIESAQKKVEAMNFDIRKQLIEFDNVMNKQREMVYKKRSQILEKEDLSEDINFLIEDMTEYAFAEYCPENEHYEKWDVVQLNELLKKIFGAKIIETNNPASITKQKVLEKIINYFEERKEKFGEEFLSLQRIILLQILDNCWKDHLYDLDQVKRGIGLRAYGQKDPIVEYKKESYALIVNMEKRIREETLTFLFHVNIIPRLVRRQNVREVSSEGNIPVSKNIQKENMRGEAAPLNRPSVKIPSKIGRNDPCPCGSGKKHKKCCGK